MDERAAAAHIVFKQAALAFVQAGGCAARQDGIIILRVNVQLIQGMAASCATLYRLENISCGI